MSDADTELDPPATRRGALAVIVPLLTLLVGAGGGYACARMLTTPAVAAATDDPATTAAPADGAPATADAGEGGEGAVNIVKKPALDGSTVTSIGTFTVNLRGSGGGRVLRLEVQLEGAAAQADSVVARTPQIRDSIITAVSDYTWSELEGTDGKTRLRDELLARVNGAAQPAVIDRIYFTQFVVQ